MCSNVILSKGSYISIGGRGAGGKGISFFSKYSIPPQVSPSCLFLHPVEFLWKVGASSPTPCMPIICYLRCIISALCCCNEHFCECNKNSYMDETLAVWPLLIVKAWCLHDFIIKGKRGKGGRAVADPARFHLSQLKPPFDWLDLWPWIVLASSPKGVR